MASGLPPPTRSLLTRDELDLVYPKHPIYEQWGIRTGVFRWRFGRVRSRGGIPALYSIRRVRGGALDYRIGGRRHRLGSGQLLLMAPGTTYRVDSRESASTAAEGVYLSDWDRVELLAEAVPYDQVVTPGPGLTALFDACVPGAESEPAAWRRAVTALLEDLRYRHAEELRHGMQLWPARRRQTVDRGRRQLAWARDFIEASLDEPISMARIAEAACVSPFQLMRLFRAWHGQSIGEYIATRRLDCAAHLLRETNLSIAEVGARVGFSSDSSFSRFFRQQAGMAPRSFRTHCADS